VDKSFLGTLVIYAIVAKNFVILAKFCCHSVGILLPWAQRSLQDDTGKIAI
jgi:hypothetical protein